MLTHSPKELALIVINQRKKLKMSQAEVANAVGLKQKTISLFENKPENIKLDTLFRILAAVNLDMIVLAKDRPESPTSQWQEEW